MVQRNHGNWVSKDFSGFSCLINKQQTFNTLATYNQQHRTSLWPVYDGLLRLALLD